MKKLISIIALFNILSFVLAIFVGIIHFVLVLSGQGHSVFANALGLLFLFFSYSFRGGVLLFAILNHKYICQILVQLVGIVYTYTVKVRFLNRLKTYTPKNAYILPFTGEWLVIGGGMSRKTSHIWYCPSQRYAYDFFISDENGKTHSGSKADVKNYYCYGQDILAPADGVVVKACDLYDDTSIMPFSLPFAYKKTLAGNYIIIEHSHKEYTFLAHLQKGSVLVSKGEKVKQGDVIAGCGNSGSSSEPHLHFQLQDGPNFFLSCTLPIKFINFEAKIFDKFSKVFNRSVASSELNDGFLTRGFFVKNN